MAVRADDFALGDLSEDLIPRPPPTYELADIEPLVPEVVEVEDHRVGLAAVDARMAQEVLQQQPLVDLPEAFPSGLDAGPADISVCRVVLDHLIDVAVTAIRLPTVSS